jgi:hypothetical protein
MKNTDNDVQNRLTLLENELKDFKKSMLSKSPENEGGKPKKEKKEKKPRVQTEYNKFVSIYIHEQKEQLGETFNHKVAFGEAAKQWTMQKEKKKEIIDES